MNLAARAILASSLVALLATAGCNIVTPVAYAIEGPGQIDAEFELPNRKTVVFVDDPRNILPRTALRTALGDAISFDLMEREILDSTVASRDAVAVAVNDQAGRGAGREEGKVVGVRLRRDRDKAFDLGTAHEQLRADPGAERVAGDPAVLGIRM